MAKPRIRRIFLKYSGDARYLQYFIQELQRQFDKSYTIDVDNGQRTATARVELNIPGLDIEWEVDAEPEITYSPMKRRRIQ
jgi:hypothetical protein